MNLQSFSNVEWYRKIIIRRWLPASVVFLAILISGILATSLRKNLYEAEAKLKLENNTVGTSSNEIDNATEIANPQWGANQIDTEVEVLQSVPLVEKTINDLRLEFKNAKGEKMSVNRFLERLKVDSITATNIIEVSYISPDPEQAAKIVNTLVKNYLENNLVENKAEAIAARTFLEEQLPKVEESLQKTETQIRQLKESNELVSPQEDTRALIQGLQQLQTQIATAKGEMANANSQANYIKEQFGLSAREPLLLTAISQFSPIKETIDKLLSAKSNLAIARTRGANEPNVIELQEQIANLEELLEQQTVAVGGEQARDILKNITISEIPEDLVSELIELEASSLGLQKQIDILSQIEQSRRDRVQRVPEVEEKLRQLSRRLELSESTYNVLWQQLETVVIAESKASENVRVISNAVVPSRPISSRSMGYLTSSSLAFLAAVGVICLLEISDRSIATVKEVKQLYGYPRLGVIPSLERLEPSNFPKSHRDPSIPKIVIRDYPYVLLNESYRMLQSNIKFANSNRAVKTIVVTSFASQEGKSTVSANLAASMAQVGNKVLLVDSNFYNPSQHRIWNTQIDNGLTDAVLEQADPRISVEEVMPNLNLLTSGTTTSSAATLLDSQRMRMLVDYWSESYDYVIFDTPSLDLSADAPIIGRMADGVLLVVRLGSVERSRAELTEEILEQSGQNVLGIVVNGAAPQFDSRFYTCNSLGDRVLGANKLSRTDSSHDDEMWQTISTLAQEIRTDRLDHNLNEDELNLAPLDKLEEMVFYLQQDLSDLTRLVKEQEEELLRQRQKVKKLQRQVNIASENKLVDWENQLNQEQERKQMLDETLVGQRRNLEKRRELLYQYQQILAVRKNTGSII